MLAATSPEEAMEPLVSLDLFFSFSLLSHLWRRKREEVADQGDPQQDRRTRNAAKAWSVDKIASSWNKDGLAERERERCSETGRLCGERRDGMKEEERDVERERDAREDGTKAILEIRAEGMGLC